MSIRSLKDEADDRLLLDNLALDLSALGVSLNQSRVYLYVLVNGSVPAYNISRDLGLHRVDVYRKLRDLQNLGIIEMYLGSPKTYVALEPKTALAKLLSRMQSRIDDLRRSSETLEKRLREFQSVRRNAEQKTISSGIHESYYRVGHGTERYYGEIARMIRNAKNEVLTVVSAQGVKQIFRTNLFKQYKDASHRGVALKFITEIGANNADYVKRLAERWQTRVLEAVHIRFVVADKSVAALRWQIEPPANSTNQDDNFFVINDSKFALSNYLFFEDLWQYGIQPSTKKTRAIAKRLAERR